MIMCGLVDEYYFTYCILYSGALFCRDTIWTDPFTTPVSLGTYPNSDTLQSECRTQLCATPGVWNPQIEIGSCLVYPSRGSMEGGGPVQVQVHVHSLAGSLRGV